VNGDGSPAQLGASWDGRGVNLALFSAHATRVELCLFTPGAERETERITLPARTGDIWHGRLEALRPGQLYGYRVHGPYDPERGHRFNPHKLLLDPYAGHLTGRVRQDDALYGFPRGGAEGDLGFDTRDSAPFMPRCVVTDPGFAWDDGDHRPRRPWSETVIYEAHVRGLTRLHPGIPESLRGTYAALGHPAVIAHLQRLGVTAIELLPIQAIADEPALGARGLVNYWGYSTIGYFSPEPRYLGPAGHVGFKAAIRALHRAGIEVILDVVYNHTAEIEETGPTLSFRGLDNATYYKPRPGDPRRTWDCTGCGNTLDVSQPAVRRLVLDSLRHWATEYGVDGFRFDLAPALAREPYGFDPRATFFAAIAADPLLSGLKLIAEPWDVGEGGYQAGNFPAGWGEWNDQFRDTIRGFWRGDPGQLPRLTQGLTGSKEIFQASGRGPAAAINYVASHDGFTLRDLVSYEHRHNEANGEGNRDGHGHNLSSNGGVEGDTADPDIRGRRAALVRAMLASVLLAQGVPMLLAGDEISRSQGGNNNPYCQDNATTWTDWEGGPAHDPDLTEFVAHLLALRREHDGLRRRTFLTGAEIPGTGMRDVYWLCPTGREMTWEDWADPARQVAGMQIGNDAPDGRRLLILINGSPEVAEFRLSPIVPGPQWRPMFLSNRADGRPDGAAATLSAGGTFAIAPRSIVLFRQEG
ncbi:MAG: hypothetical protein JWR86_690, partial [Enterovirga sp.]|nr:hypothetical protein [Enterovirga sp.]